MEIHELRGDLVRKRGQLFLALLGVLAACLSGCALFTTRDPEPPDARRSSFQPPVSAQTVVNNLQGAFREKNAENYAQCLLGGDAAAASSSAARQFVFEPSAEAAARFASVFSGWSVARERQAFLAMSARIPASESPALVFSNERFESQMPDSAVYVADYSLKPRYALTGLPAEYTGKLRFVILAQPNGFWAVARWSDQQLDNASATSASWSALKAQFAN